MENNDLAQQPYVAPFIRCLTKGATEKEIVEASENLRQYLLVLYDIGLERESKAALVIETSCSRNRRKRQGLI